MSDPFAYHPELRNRIVDAESSYFRTFSLESVMAQHPHLEAIRQFAYSDAEREAIRARALADHTGDLWVFAFGSLMWDPALRFAEVRRAWAAHHERRFILLDDKGGRGSPDAPGLLAALDVGAGCDGLAFRIRAEDVAAETEILFRREALGPGYLPGFVPARIAGAEVTALTFLADHACPEIRTDITFSEQIRYIATGSGFLGTSRDYLARIVDQFAYLGIEDAHCAELLQAVDVFPAAEVGSDRA